MKNEYLTYIKLTVLLIAFLSLASCSNDDNPNNLDETIFVRHKNADMPAYIRGNGAEKVFLVTLHGGPGGGGLEFVGDAFNIIEDQYGVVYFDQRGSGMSQGSYTEEDVSLDLMAEDVLALVKVLKRKYGNDSQFFLLGHSWGGTLGTATLVKDQSDFIGWIEVDGANNPAGLYDQYIETFTITANAQIALGNSVDFWESILEFVSKVDPISNLDDFSELNSRAFDLEEKLTDDGFINNPVSNADRKKLTFEYNASTAIWNGRQIATILIDQQGLFQVTDFTSQLPEITIPSLFISGQYDMIVPVVSAQKAFENIGSEVKELQIFDRSGHSPLDTEPERFAAEVLRFLEANKQ
ncbi:alpha/beta hydrolase [uncultured Croceitalea sp.]|uniref:alpha/beta fold hydrolase n=1 Tax=uncultured Croceitalea sp. TaxID=1798908 RepID=UPI0033056A3F